MTTYVLHSAIWTVFGFVLGFMVSRLTRDVRRIADAVTDEGAAPMTEVSANPRKRKRPSGRLVVGAVVVLLGLITAVQGIYQDARTREVAEQAKRAQECTTAYSNGFADALDARSSASASAQEALDDLMETVGQLTTGAEAGTPEVRARFRTALDEYLKQRAESKKQQANNPFPPPPRDLCR